MREFRKKVIKLAISGVMIFSLGVFIGYKLDTGAITSIQGYLFNAVSEATSSNATSANATNSNATSANATSTNATSANATSTNATSTNATSSNATSANAVSSTDNIIYLSNFSLEKTIAKVGDSVGVRISTIGAYNSAATIVFENSTGGMFTVNVLDIASNPYFVVPVVASNTTYSVTSVLLVGKNSDGTTFTKQYTKNGTNSYRLNSTLTISAQSGSTGETQNKEIKLEKIKLESSSVSVSDIVDIDINASEALNILKLLFKSNTSEFVAYAKGLVDGHPYIEIPSSTVAGIYKLREVTLSSDEVTTIYTLDGKNGAKKFNFNISLEIKQKEVETYIYNNEQINSEVITKLYNAPIGTNITVNADSNTIINGEVFNSIKGKAKTLTINHRDNQIIFNGLDISDSKTIDVNMSVEKVSDNEKISKLVHDGIIVNFPDNGNLPGKALVRVKATEAMKSILNDHVYVYVYNEDTNDFCEIGKDASKSADNYYEFTITHNSSYLIVNEELDSRLVVSTPSSNVVSFQKENRTLLLLIAIGIAVIIATIIALIVILKKKKEMSVETTTKNEEFWTSGNNMPKEKNIVQEDNVVQETSSNQNNSL